MMLTQTFGHFRQKLEAIRGLHPAGCNQSHEGQDLFCVRQTHLRNIAFDDADSNVWSLPAEVTHEALQSFTKCEIFFMFARHT